MNIKCVGFGAVNGLFGDYMYSLVDRNIRKLAGRFTSILSEQDIDDIIHDSWLHAYEQKGSFPCLYGTAFAD